MRKTRYAGFTRRGTMTKEEKVLSESQRVIAWLERNGIYPSEEVRSKYFRMLWLTAQQDSRQLNQ